MQGVFLKCLGALPLKCNHQGTWQLMGGKEPNFGGALLQVAKLPEDSRKFTFPLG